MANAIRKIRLTRSIVLEGKHAKQGEVHECPAPLAQRLVGSGSAEWHEDSAEEAAAENRKGVQVHVPHAEDPAPRKVSEAPSAPAPAAASPRPKAKSGS